jgi:hypothetical protein
MSLFDLLFLLAFLSSFITLATVAVAAMQGRRAKARRVVTVWGICAAVYLALSLAVSYTRPQGILRVGEPWCFDDWCLVVDQVSQTPAPPQVSYNVQFRIFSRAGRATQRANGAWMYLIDERGHRYSPQADPSAVPLDVVLRPNESVSTSRVFRVPAGVHTLGLITGHGGAYCGAMSVLVIGEGGCWFNKPAMIRVQ